MHHIMSNQYIEFTSPTEARVHYYWQTVFGGPGVSPTPRVAAVGNGVDDVVKVDGRWLIRSRNVPAVWLASQLRQPSLHGLLQRAGIQGLREE